MARQIQNRHCKLNNAKTIAIIKYDISNAWEFITMTKSYLLIKMCLAVFIISDLCNPKSI